MKKSISFIILFFTFISANSQNYFKAIVKDGITKETIIGASVFETGTSNGTSTDINGKVKFLVSKIGSVNISIQFIGYKSYTIVVQIPQKDTLIEILLSPEPSDLEEVVVTSTRTNSRIENIPTRIEVLGTEDMNEENGIKPGNIMSLLGDIAGIQMQQVSASSGNTYARIQGLNGRYTQLLKDGMPLYGGLSGSFGIMQIPPLDLKQIEIIKGSCATLYGGDAIGGIINLVSKAPSEAQEISLTANQTSLLETNINGYASKQYKKMGYSFFIGQTFQKEKDIDKDGLSDVPFVNNTVIHPKLVLNCSKKLSLTLNYTATFDHRMGGDLNYFSSPSSDTLYHINNTMQRHTTDAKFVYTFSKDNNLTFKLSSSLVDQNLETKFYNFNASQLIYYSEASYFHQLKKMNWVAGINFNGDQLNNKNVLLTEIQNYHYQTTGIFIQNTYTPFHALTIESGFRLDYHSTYNFFPLPRLSFMYKINPAIMVRINGGLGYKIPIVTNYINLENDLNKLAYPISLQAEHSQGINADINFQKYFQNKASITFNQSFFFTNLSAPIYDSSSTSNIIALANASKALQTKGIQSYARITIDELEIYLSYVFTDILKLYDNKYPLLIATPKHNLSTVIAYDIGNKIRLGIEASFIAGQLNENYSDTKNYFLCAAMIQYNIGKVSIVLNGENLLNFKQSKYEKIYDGSIYNPQFHQLWAPIDGRVINLSIKWKL